ncbi:MAG: HAMP domain-containing protein [Ignavibacteriae bacterium]|nr:HAMP domain-containing protein [Ignavibacteriota bacterium]
MTQDTLARRSFGARFADVPFRRKLILLTMSVAGISVLLAITAFAVYDILAARSNLIASVALLGDVVASSSSAAVVFDDRTAAGEALRILTEQKNIRAARVYSGTGAPLAEYFSDDDYGRALPQSAPPEGYGFTDNGLEVTRPVLHNNQRIGSLLLISNLQLLNDRLTEIAVMLVLSLGFIGLTAYLLSSRLQRHVAAPILDLARTARAVTDGGDYSLRAPKHGRDEVGELSDRFNEMLRVVASRDEALRREIEIRVQAEEELRHAAVRLERSNRELQDFASVASHDLQEPLRKVLAFGDRLKRGLGGQLDERSADHLERMLKAAARMQILINDLLTYSRVTTKAQPYTQVDLSALVREVISDLEIRIEQADGTVSLGSLPTISADPMQMRQLFQNLIGNALKYHRPNVPPIVTITAECVPSKNGVCDTARITIADNGIGFEEQYSEQIFVIFQRLHGRGEYEGTGIGLAVCKKIVDRHGGRISATGVPDQGAHFIVELPLAQGIAG